MQIYLAGAEKGSYRSSLVANGVSRLAFNYTQLAIPKRKEMDLKTLTNGASILFYQSEGDENLDEFDIFLREHIDSIDHVITNSGHKADWMDGKNIPLWNDGEDVERLAALCQRSPRVAVSDKALTAKNTSRVRQLQQRWSTEMFIFSSKVDVLESLPWEAAVVASWTSAIRYGETQVWDGHALRRYPSQHKQSARSKHRADIVRLGIDIDAVMEDSSSEVGRLAILSWLAWEKRTFGAYDPLQVEDDDEQELATITNIVAKSPVEHSDLFAVPDTPSIAINTPNKRHEGGKVLLPVFELEQVITPNQKTFDDQGEGIEVDPDVIPLVRLSGDSLRQCDNCYLASNCPAFQPHTECAYRLPVEIRTKDQLQAALRALLEMQVSRVMFGKFAEDLEGQGMSSLTRETWYGLRWRHEAVLVCSLDSSGPRLESRHVCFLVVACLLWKLTIPMLRYWTCLMPNYECPDCFQTFSLMSDFLGHPCLDEDAGVVHKRKPKGGRIDRYRDQD
jgi:hypothetical protein